MYDVMYVLLLLLLLLCPFSFALTSPRDGPTGAAETETDGRTDGTGERMGGGKKRTKRTKKGKGAPELHTFR